MAKNYDVLVIGGGHNGLTLACKMAKKGKSVCVVEKQKHFGGLAARREFLSGYFTNGFLQDTSLVAREMIEDLQLEDHGVQWNEKVPEVYVPSIDGQGIYLGASQKGFKEFKEFIRRVSGPIQSFLESVPPHFEQMTLSEKIYLLKTATSLRMLGKKDMLEVLRVPPMSVADWLSEWFEGDLLKAGMALGAVSCTNVGPWAPGTAINLLFKEVQSQKGLKGGPSSLIDGLLGVGRSLGIEFVEGNPVKEVLVQSGKVSGVLLSDGKQLEAKSVYSSCDPKNTFFNLFSPIHLPTKLEEQVKHYRSKGSVGVLNFALKNSLIYKGGESPVYSRIVESLDQIEKAFDVLKYGELATVPALEVFNSGLLRSGDCSAGQGVVSVLYHCVPYSEHNNDQLRAEMVNNAKTLIAKVTDSFDVVGEEAFTPYDLEKQFSLTGGHLTHGEHAIDQMIVRPVPECSRFETPIENFYLCGSGSFPGGFLTCRPGALASQI